MLPGNSEQASVITENEKQSRSVALTSRAAAMLSEEWEGMGNDQDAGIGDNSNSNLPGYPAFGLSHKLQGYPPDRPTSVRFRYVPNSPFGFLQTPPLPVTPLPTSCLPAG